MVARGAAIFAAGKASMAEFKHDGDEYAVLNVSACDVLPGRVLLANRGETKELRYDKVCGMWDVECGRTPSTTDKPQTRL